MIRCNRCGSDVPETSQFCGICGAPLTADVGIYKEKECLNNFCRFFKYERLCWKIFGIVWLVLSCVWFFLSFIMLFLVVEEPEFAAAAVMYMFAGLMYLPIAIVNLKMVGRAEHYMNIVYNDAAVEERAGNVGMIVLSAFFNNIAMVFIIINFVSAKNNKDILRSAHIRQSQYKISQ